MSILKYNEYLTEKQIFDLINESVLIFSPKLMNLLKRMSRNRIAQELVKLNKSDVEGITQNYIDVTDRETFSFTPDRRVQQMLAARPVVWKCIHGNKCLTHGDANDAIFTRLEYNKEEPWAGGAGNRWSVNVGQVMKILSETTSKSSGKVYCKVEETNRDGSDMENPRISVINKEGLELYAPELDGIWTTARNPLRIGRMARAILTASGIEFTDHELSQFVEQFTATFDFASDALRQFTIVKGDQIHYWYNSSRYVSGHGSLNNSCMSSASRDKLAIYCENSNIELVILYSDEGEVVDGVYQSNKIKGRAILWRNCTINGEKVDFMDRIYTTYESDTELFKQFAEKEGLFFKTNQGYAGRDISNGARTINKPDIVCDLEKSDFNMYPYMDTMYCIDVENNKAANDNDINGLSEDRIRYCQHTDGTWEGYGEDSSYGDEEDDDDW
jgi:hypothetical protein